MVMIIELEPDEWMRQALCAQTDPMLFYPEEVGGKAAQQAKKICKRCPVREACLTYALEHGECFGIWGGTSYRQRRRMRGWKPPINGYFPSSAKDVA